MSAPEPARNQAAQQSTAPGVCAAQPRRPTRPGRVGIIAGMVLLSLGTCLYSVTVLEQLLLGWIYFPLRVVPQMTVDWPSVAVGTFCAAGFLAALHLTVQWIASRLPARLESGPWQPGVRTTGVLALALGLLFASGTAMVGATHQLIWLATGQRDRGAARGTEPLAVGGLIASELASARRTETRNNLHQLGLAVNNFADTFEMLPPGGTIDDRGRMLHGWAIFLGGFVGYSHIGIDFSVPWNEPPNDRLYRCAVPDYINPAVPEVFDSAGYGLSHFAGNVHVLPISRVTRDSLRSEYGVAWNALRGRDDAARRNLPLTFGDIRDGQANTIFVGEAAGRYRPWGHPANVRDPALGVGQSLDGFGGPAGAGGAQFVMLDGSVRFISDRVDRKVIQALGTPAGGEAVEFDNAQR